jgi:predicted enzyme related to lactoylglutathione lyase
MTTRNPLIRCRLSLSLAALVLLLIAGPVLTQTVAAQEDKSVSLQLDHVTICGSSLDTLRQAFTDVGLTPDPGGAHANGITQMASVGFDDSTYIDLIAPIKLGASEGSPWAKFMSEDAVACAWAASASGLQQEVDRLKKAGITVKAPEPGSRKRPDGMSIEWTTAAVGSSTPGATLPFLIEDVTPRAWRGQTSASVQGSPLSGVENVVLGVSNLDASIALFRKAYGWTNPLIETQKDFGKLAYFPGEPVILAAPAGGGWLSDHISKFGEAPVAYLLNARDFSAATKKYKLNGGKTWFGQKVAWFDAGKLKGVRLGVIGQ